MKVNVYGGEDERRDAEAQRKMQRINFWIEKPSASFSASPRLGVLFILNFKE
jgi:hypothetical protein